MRILSLAAVTPPRRFDNDQFLHELDGRLVAVGVPADRRGRLGRRLRTLFRRAGTERRFIHYPPAPGYAAAILRDAALEALSGAGLAAEAVDLIIYCSVARGWLEPSSAAAAQAAIGARNASCFDVLEACAGWMRAVEVADALLRAGRYRNALILGVEAGMQDILLPPRPDADFADEHLAAFTLGEAATAMVVGPGDTPPPEIVLRSDGEQAGICMLPLSTIEAFRPPGEPTPQPERFHSQAERLFTRVGAGVYQVMKERLARMAPGEVDLFILHSASARAGEVMRRALGIPVERWFCTHAEFGNTVSQSMPVALRHAFRTGRAKPGDRVCFLVGSAGITYGYGILTV